MNHGDTEEVVEMASRMLGESAYAFLPFDREKVQRFVTGIIGKSNIWCGLIAEENGAIAGMFIGYLTDYFFCNEKLACDIVLFVAREYRGSSAAVKLIRTFREWAVERGARELCLGISTNVNVERIGRFYERMDFTRVGGIYKQRLG